MYSATPASLQAARKRRVEVGEQLRVAGHVPGIEQRSADRGVLGALDQAVLDRAGGVADLHAEVPQEVEHVLDHLQRLTRRVLGGQEQQVDVAERREHAAPISASAGDREMLRFAKAGVRRGVIVQRRDKAVGQLAQQAGGLQAGDLLLLEGMLHMLLDAGEMAAECTERCIARHRGTVFGQRGERGGEGGYGRLGWLRLGDRGQHSGQRYQLAALSGTANSDFSRYKASSASRGVMLSGSSAASAPASGSGSG